LGAGERKTILDRPRKRNMFFYTRRESEKKDTLTGIDACEARKGGSTIVCKGNRKRAGKK